MNGDDLRVVSTINRAGSFTRGARLLEADETTIARRLARIKAALSVPLFVAVEGQTGVPGCQIFAEGFSAPARAAILAVSALAGAAGGLALAAGPDRQAAVWGVLGVSAVAGGVLSTWSPAIPRSRCCGPPARAQRPWPTGCRPSSCMARAMRWGR